MIMVRHSECQEDAKKTIKNENYIFSTYAYKNNQQEVTLIPVSKHLFRWIQEVQYRSSLQKFVDKASVS